MGTKRKPKPMPRPFVPLSFEFMDITSVAIKIATEEGADRVRVEHIKKAIEREEK